MQLLIERKPRRRLTICYYYYRSETRKISRSREAPARKPSGEELNKLYYSFWNRIYLSIKAIGESAAKARARARDQARASPSPALANLTSWQLFFAAAAAAAAPTAAAAAVILIWPATSCNHFISLAV